MNIEARRAYREAELSAALATDPQVGEPELEVVMTTEAVIVRGVVPTTGRRAAVHRVIARLAPDMRFVDEMEIASTFPPPAGDEASTA